MIGVGVTERPDDSELVGDSSRARQQLAEAHAWQAGGGWRRTRRAPETGRPASDPTFPAAHGRVKIEHDHRFRSSERRRDCRRPWPRLRPQKVGQRNDNPKALPRRNTSRRVNREFRAPSSDLSF